MGINLAIVDLEEIPFLRTNSKNWAPFAYFQVVGIREFYPIS